MIPLDRIVIPAQDELPPLKELVQKATANRADLAAERDSLTSAQILALGTANGVLPSLVAFGGDTQAGLAGKGRAVTVRGQTFTPDPRFIGGLGTALGQALSPDFPSARIGAFFQASIYNRQAQADYGIDQLQLRQQQLTMRKDHSQAEVDVLNSVVALRQARARYEAAMQNRILNQQLLDAEQKKFGLGARRPTTSFNSSGICLSGSRLRSPQRLAISARASPSTRRLGRPSKRTIYRSATRRLGE